MDGYFREGKLFLGKSGVWNKKRIFWPTGGTEKKGENWGGGNREAVLLGKTTSRSGEDRE